MIDTIVVGGGHNGLTCAAYLARAGKRVTVLESASSVGGYCTTEATVAEAPGYLMNTGGIDHLLVNMPPSVVDELQLSRYGLRYIPVDPIASYLGPDGATLPLWCDLDRAVAEVAKFSRRDAEQYRKFVNVLADTVHVMLPYLAGHPKKVRPGAAVDVLKRGARRRKSLGAALRIMMMSNTAVLEEWFEREEVRSALGAYASFTLTPIETPGVGLTLVPIMHRWGLRRPIGGSGAFTQALAADVRAHGGEIRTDAPVREVLVRDGRAHGVLLESGETLHAANVVGALDPTTLLTRLIDPELLPDRTRGELRGLQVGEHNLACFKADVALRGRPRFPNHGGGDPTVVAQSMPATLTDVKAATRRAMQGEFADGPIPLTVWMPSVFDRTLVPAGSEGESLYIYPIATPRQLSGGRDWKDEKQGYLDRCLDTLEIYAPGTKDLVIGANIRSPEDFGSHNGHIYHVDMLPWQFGPWRPTPSLAGYRTPIDGLWHTAAGAHPIGGISGWPGRAAARTIIKDAKG